MESSTRDARLPGPTVGPTDRRPTVVASASLSRNEWLLLLAFWAFIAALNAANSILDPRAPGVFAFSAGAPILIAVLQSVIWASLTVPIFWLANHLDLEHGSLVRRLLVVLLVGMALAIAVDTISAWLRFGVFPRSARAGSIPFGPLVTVQRFFFIDDFIVFLVVLSAGLARSYFARLRGRQDEAVRLEAHTSRLQAQLADAKLHALRAQIDPHFLFNTLHAVSSLVERDPRGVRRMVARLSEMLRERLAEPTAEETTLEQELASLERYLDIMRIRFQGSLAVDMHIEPATRTALVPTLILQPVVENAIKHGVSQLPEGGLISLRAERVAEDLVITVRDNGPGPTATASSPAGLGVRNTRARLEALYGNAQRFTLQAAEGGGAEVAITLPYHTADDLRVHAVSDAASIVA